VDVRRIGDSLGVCYVLEGSVRRDGDKLRVTMQLIDAADGYHVWAQSYDRSWRDVIAIQDDIARSVTDALRLVLAPRTRRGRARCTRPTAGLRSLPRGAREAAPVRRHEAAARGRAQLRRVGRHRPVVRAGPRRVLRRRHAAVPAHARSGLPGPGRAGLPAGAGPRPALLEAEKALAGLYEASGRLGEAEEIYRRLISRNPGDADGQIGLGRTLESADGSKRPRRATAPRCRRNPPTGEATAISAPS